MKNYIQNIELINDYLNNRLSEKEVQDFENRLKVDKSFAKELETHVLFLEGLNRQQLKGEIKKAKQSYVKSKWFKYLGFTSGLGLVLLVIIYFNGFNSDKEYLKSKMNFESEYVQNFQVATDSIVKIVGEKGTVIQFNPKDVETNSNEPFVGDFLKVGLIELTTKQDLLLANAQTSSNKKWLISNGAFKIDIRANGGLLVLKEGKTISVKFPKNSSEDSMQIFYGERDKESEMNWDVSNIKLEDEKYFTIFYKDSSAILDSVLTKQFGVDMFKRVVISDTLGYLYYKNIVEKFPKINDIKIDNDTLRVYDVTFRYQYNNLEIDSLFSDAEVLQRKYISISKNEIENIIKHIDVDYFINEETFDSYNKFANSFYESVELSKLGWINIDKFANDEVKVNIKLDFNINTNHNEIYIIDQKNNTVLNVYNHEIDLPINGSFYIIAIGIKGKDIYGFKKLVRFKKRGNLKVDYKKINESQIKSILTLDPIKSLSIEDSNKTEKPKIKEVFVKNTVETKRKIAEVKTSKPVKTKVISLKKPVQKLKINTQKDTVIVCKEGTKLDIKANSFVDSNGNLVKGNIDLDVTEYYKLSDMLLANLSTTSNGKPLETGGMLNINASKGDELLKLKSSIEISFPTKSKKEGMQLFSGEWENGNVNWKLQKEIEETAIIEEVEVEEIDEDIEVAYAVIEEVPIYPGCEKGNRLQKRRCTSAAIQKFVQRNFNTSITQGLRLSGRQRVNVFFKIDKFGNITSVRSRGPHPLIEQEANRVIATLPKMTPGKQRGRTVTVPYSLPIVFTISEATEVNITLGEINSTPIDNQVEYDTLYTKVRGKVEQIRAVMHDKGFKVDPTFIKIWEIHIKNKQIRFFGELNNRKVILRKPLFKKENTRFKVLEDDSISRGGHIIRKVWNESQIPTTSRIMRLVPKPQIIVGNKAITEEEFKKRLENPNDNKAITTKAINNYAMSVLDLGWINCDRFINNRNNSINYKLKIKNRNGSAKVSMVFKSLSSILPSRNIKGHFNFGAVANNEDVTLVAIKKHNGKLYLDIIDTSTKSNPDIKFNFKEVSLDEMKNELVKLNNLF